MTFTLLFVLAFGFLCAWILLKAAKWLPLVVLLPCSAWGQSCTGGSCNHDVFWRNSSGGTICVNQTCSGPATCSSCPANIGQTISPGQTICFGENNTGDTYNYFVYAGGTCSGTPVCTQAGSGGTTAVTWVYPGCTNLPPTYYWNYCITNNSGLAMQVEWVGSPNNSAVINLGPGQYYCFSGSGTSWGFGGFTTAYFNPDGTATNISIWPPTGPNGTNNVPGNGGGYNPGGPGGPGSAQGPGASIPGSNTNLTGNQYYAGVSNLQQTLAGGFTYLGNEIGSQGTLIGIGNGLLFNISNGVLTMINEQTNLMQSGVQTTNLLTQQTNAMALLSSNVVNLNSNLVAGFSNLLAGLGGTNQMSVGDGNSISNMVGTNEVGFSNSMAGSWGQPFAGGGLTNISGAASNGSYWFIPFPTNPLAAFDSTHPVNDAHSGLDLDPRHNSYFIGFASFSRNIEVWLITFFIMWQLRSWMSDRLFKALLTPSNSIKLDPAAAAQYVVRVAWGGAVLLTLPAVMAAIAYNFGLWSYFETALDPLGSAALSAAGSVGPYIGDAISIVANMVPLAFLGGGMIYLGIVWLGLDVAVAAAMFKLRYS